MATVASISQQIWDMKYRLKGPANGAIAGEPIDKTIEDTWRRVARALAAPEKDPAHWAERFYAAMRRFPLPAGRPGHRRRRRGSRGDAVQLLCHGQRSPTTWAASSPICARRR